VPVLAHKIDWNNCLLVNSIRGISIEKCKIAKIYVKKKAINEI
jgi:hypothetical protein